MTFKSITHLSEEYYGMVQLRIRVLLQPSGIPDTYIQPANETSDVHIGAFEDGKIIGCCVLTDRGEGTVQLRQMAVEAAYQAKGVGAAIVQYAERVAREKGFRLLYLHARNGVMGFYQKSGYTVQGAQFFEVGIAHHRMEKLL